MFAIMTCVFFISKIMLYRSIIELSVYMGYINAANKYVFFGKAPLLFLIFTTLALLQVKIISNGFFPGRAPDKSYGTTLLNPR